MIHFSHIYGGKQMQTMSFNNMSCDYTVYQNFSSIQNDSLKEKRDYLEEQIAWTEEQIEILQEKLDQLQCLLEYVH